jgi:hypothetical protein
MPFSFLQHIADFSDSDLARPAAAIDSVNESAGRPAREAAWSCTLDLIARYTPLSCNAGLVSIELEDANANPDPSGLGGARTRRLQRQSGDQSLLTSGPLCG